MTAIEQATQAILSTYGDPLRVAADFKIDNAEIQAAMKEAEPGSGYRYALSLLAEVNPPKPVKAKA
jgi:hypothetical protein